MGKAIDFSIDENNCFNVTSHAKIKGGYHRIKKMYKSEVIHRHIFEECFGFIPEGLIVRHKCDNPSCINPEHLELGTPKDNMQDKSKRGRCNAAYGTRVKQSKLDPQKVLEIRGLLNKGLTLKNIADRFGVSETTIWRVKEGESWVRAKETKELAVNANLPN